MKLNNLSSEELINELERRGDYVIFKRVKMDSESPNKGPFLYETIYGLEFGFKTEDGNMFFCLDRMHCEITDTLPSEQLFYRRYMPWIEEDDDRWLKLVRY